MGSVGIESGAALLERFSLKGKNIVITGCGQGLGLNFGNGLAEAGANIAGIDIRAQPHGDFEKLTRFGGKAKYYQADARNYDQMKAVIDQVMQDFGRIDGCIPAAGIVIDKPFTEHTASDFNDTFNVNILGVAITVQLCAANMIKQKAGGNIVCIASIASHKAMYPQTCAAYVASKFAVRGLVKQVAGELAPYNIRCNSISPGTVRTDMLEAVMKQTPGRKELFINSNYLGRLAEPDELNGAMLYLMSNASSYVTGNDFLVDGGVTGLLD